MLTGKIAAQQRKVKMRNSSMPVTQGGELVLKSPASITSKQPKLTEHHPAFERLYSPKAMIRI